jgi:multidrug efflux system outer membrane protein
MTGFLRRLAPVSPILWLAAAAVAGASPDVRTNDPAVAELRHAVETEDPSLAALFDRPISRDALLELALQRNLGLDVARRAHAMARANIGIANGEFYPELQLGANGRRIEDASGTARRKDAEVAIVQRLPIGTALSAGVRFEDTNGDTAPATGIPNVALTQPLLRGAGWSANTSGIRDAQLGCESQEQALRAEVLRITFAVDTAYFEILRRQQLIEVNQRAVARDEELLEFSKAKLAAQLATQRDVLSAEIILAQDRGRLVNAEAQHQAALDDMSDLLGLRIGRPFEVQHVELEIAAREVDEAASVDTALRDNPDIQRGRIELERARLSRDVAGNDRLPQLDLRVGYSQRREPLDNEPNQRTWEGGVVLSYPFLNKTLGGLHERAGLEYEQQRRAALQVERQTILNVRDAVRNLQRSQDRISILKKNIEGAQAKVEFARVNFQLGRASNLDITDAQKDLLDAETDFVNELVFYRQSLARLDQLTGGSM